ncbi:MAG: GNAT family N-acetyltransferase [Oscillospiraceae bacterium]|jgi:GNAT superfamily N-acetyltransferase|nr:GNAT family N-acetyltransferase [Oscillospiraceae bacterium]
MDYDIRRARAEEVRPALEMAYRVFEVYEAPDYAPEAAARFRADVVENEAAIRNWASGGNTMFIALDGEKIIGVIGEKGGNGHINIVFVDGAYHRRGIATALMQAMVGDLQSRGFERVTLFSSPYGVPFYRHFGFIPTGEMHESDGFLIQPMAYSLAAR